MAQLTYTDKSLKKMIDLFPKYQNALGEEEVVEHFRNIVVKVSRLIALMLMLPSEFLEILSYFLSCNM